jgi:disulfide bond formation protein DsbB
MYDLKQQNSLLFAPIDKGFTSLLWLTTLVLCGTITSALLFEYVGGYIPCKLCLGQREPYYAAIPFCFLALSSHHTMNYKWMTRGCIAIIGCLMLFGLTLSIFHAGVEWHLWQGPADCGATAAGKIGNTKDLLAALKNTKAPSCDSATWRMLGLSFAGWNAVISAILAACSFWVALSAPKRDA